MPQTQVRKTKFQKGTERMSKQKALINVAEAVKNTKRRKQGIEMSKGAIQTKRKKGLELTAKFYK